ncbi:Uncharacterised protein [Mycolicibacterium vanbaalenii]|uniref:Uncharacterized protein n=1 Tax=Mycolicibacterium vanbaalenii TaxID=110539 RepID=A0A5S9QXC5_MYCVN|nr:hypothetical protein [Mycolicibacterium vanbaalenii]CAA0124523.1 Uncharacterised protein [Mycolicibacterium vanbaalenii]
MLFIHDTVVVIGAHQFDFEDAVREGYATAVADDDTRFLSYRHAVHGSSEGYLVTMLTAVRDGVALDRLAHRMRYGDLAAYATKVAALRYRCHSTLLVRAEWMDAPELELAEIPVADIDHDTAFFREDILEGPGIDEVLAQTMAAGQFRGGNNDVLTFDTAFRPALETDTAARVVYRINDADDFVNAWRTDIGWDDWPGSLTPQLPDGVHSCGRYLRSVRWSPLP